MNRTLSFLFAAALGATLGAFTAVEIASLISVKSGLAATLGVMVGGLVGYIAIDFRGFCRECLSAGRLAYRLPAGLWGIVGTGFTSYWDTPRASKINGLYMGSLILLIGLYMSIPSILDGVDTVPEVPTMMLVLMVVVMSLFFTIIDAEDTKSPRLDMKIIFYWVSPIGIAHFVFLKALPWLVVGLYKSGRWLVRQTGVFGKTLFVAVHSERRMLCCLDAMLGTLVGYYLGSWPAGTLAGLVFALISYELISKRLLKLQSA